MQKKTPDYDNVFKTMKMKHKRLFISVINETFGKHYPTDARVETLPSEGFLTENETADGSKDIEEQISDFVLKIENEIYLLECQSVYRCKAICGLGYRPCDHSHAEIFNHLYQEDGKNSKSNHDHVHISGWAGNQL